MLLHSKASMSWVRVRVRDTESMEYNKIYSMMWNLKNSMFPSRKETIKFIFLFFKDALLINQFHFKLFFNHHLYKAYYQTSGLKQIVLKKAANLMLVTTGPSHWHQLFVNWRKKLLEMQLQIILKNTLSLSTSNMDLSRKKPALPIYWKGLNTQPKQYQKRNQWMYFILIFPQRFIRFHIKDS